MRLKPIITAILLLFVAASVSHLAGQELGLWGRPGRVEDRDATPFPAGNRVVSLLSASRAPRLLGDRVAVYYLHDAKRCDTCLKTERMTLDLLRRDFAEAAAAGRLEWRTMVIGDSAEAARRYGAASNALVVAEIRGEKEQSFTRMDDLWKFLDDPARFDARVASAIRERLPGDAP